jgi:hypothetical protein
MMKGSFMKSPFFAAALFATLALGASAMAASSGTLTISGTVAVINDIVVTPNASATQLDIVNGETGLSVAGVAETSNNLNGYKITMASANNGQLVNGSDSAIKTAYKVGYDGASSVALTTAATTVKNVSSLSGLTTANSDVKVDVTALPSALAGTYSDTITVAIVAN